MPHGRNKGNVAEQNRRYRQRHADVIVRWRKDNADKIREANRARQRRLRAERNPAWVARRKRHKAREVAELRDSYIRTKLGLTKDYCPQSLVEAKLALMKLRRVIREKVD